MAYKMIVPRFEKSHCLLKSSVPLPWQPSLITTLSTGVINKLLIQTSGPIPTDILLNPASLLWTGISNRCICHKTFYISIKCIIAFHVNMLQQLHLPINSIICNHKKIPSKTFNLFNTGDPKSRNSGIAEWRKMTPNPKTWNGGKWPQILKHGTAENDPKS